MKTANFYLRLEGAAIFVGSLIVYLWLDFNFLWFLLTILLVDVFMAGYLFGNKIGAHVYNFGHSLIAPILLLCIGLITDTSLCTGAGLVWAAHIGMDRTFGFGLKKESGFKHTNLGDL